MAQLDIADKWVKEQISKLSDEVLDDYNKGIYTLDDLNLFFEHREKALQEWEQNKKESGEQNE